jgi:UDP-N-acetylmuramyl pentapeptide phosphotransferase/UDP-N-acetylglucosamine-1-phosphate transferase
MLNFFLIAIITIFFIYFYNRNNWVLSYLRTNDEFSNENSIHTQKKIFTGTGIVFLIIFYFGIFFYSFQKIYYPHNFFYFVAMLSIITIISFIDDIKRLDPIFRLLIQLICVYSSLTSLNLVSINIPFKISILLSVILWIYFTNITNFIDGSDGVCCINVLNFFFGILILNYFYNFNFFSVTIAKIIIPILMAFLLFNYPSAKNYMGDAGSIFLGFLVGFSALEFIIGGFYVIIILYIYPLLDCSISLTKKILKGYWPWERLSDYYYLIPKKKNSYNNSELAIVSKKIFYYFVTLSSLNIFFLILSIYFNIKLLLIFNILFSFILINIFRGGRIKIY